MLNALTLLSRQGHISVGAVRQTPRLRKSAVKGVMEPAAALAALLANSAWQAWIVAPGIWQLRPRVKKPRAPARHHPSPEQVGAPIIVTATKRDERLSAAPTSTTVILGSLIDASSPARGTSDFAAQAEGVFSTNLGPRAGPHLPARHGRQPL